MKYLNNSSIEECEQQQKEIEKSIQRIKSEIAGIEQGPPFIDEVDFSEFQLIGTPQYTLVYDKEPFSSFMVTNVDSIVYDEEPEYEMNDEESDGEEESEDKDEQPQG